MEGKTQSPVPSLFSLTLYRYGVPYMRPLMPFRLKPPLRWILLALLLGGAAGAQQIEISGNGVPIQNNDLTPSLHDGTDFGAVDFRFGLKEHVFVITNRSQSTPLRIFGISGWNAEFTIPIAPAQIIGPGQSTSMLVRFNPGIPGARSTTFRVSTNLVPISQFTFALRGEGTQPKPEINIQGNERDILDGDATPSLADHTHFGNVDIDDDPFIRTYVVQNVGDLPLEISRIEFIGDSTGFSIVEAPPATVNPLQIGRFRIAFDPERTGRHFTQLRLLTNDQDELFYDFIIEGTGTTTFPEFELYGNGERIADQDTTPSPDDGTHLGSSSVGSPTEHTFSIRNSGTASLSIAQMELVGLHPDDFAVVDQPTTSIPAGGAAQFSIVFTPKASGSRRATLRILSNDPADNTFEFALLGIAGQAKLLKIEKIGFDAKITFASNPDTSVGVYFYQLEHSADLEEWFHVSTVIARGAEVKEVIHFDGFDGKARYWRLKEQRP